MKKINWKLVVSIVLVIVLLLVILSMTGVISFKKNEHLRGMNGISETPKVTDNEKEEVKEDNQEEVVNEKPALNDDLTFDKEIKTTETVVYAYGDNGYDDYATLTVKDGNIVVKTTRYVNDKKDETYQGETKTITIKDEKVKYITSYYYQPGAGTYIMVLTEKGNIYYNAISAHEDKPEPLDNFKKDKYSNVTGIVRIDNRASEENDRDLYYFGVIINGKTEKVDYKWN